MLCAVLEAAGEHGGHCGHGGRGRGLGRFAKGSCGAAVACYPARVRRNLRRAMGGWFHCTTTVRVWVGGFAHLWDALCVATDTPLHRASSVRWRPPVALNEKGALKTQPYALRKKLQKMKVRARCRSLSVVSCPPSAPPAWGAHAVHSTPACPTLSPSQPLTIGGCASRLALVHMRASAAAVDGGAQVCARAVGPGHLHELAQVPRPRRRVRRRQRHEVLRDLLLLR